PKESGALRSLFSFQGTILFVLLASALSSGDYKNITHFPILMQALFLIFLLSGIYKCLRLRSGEI
ncbi:hypothetical protein, partial [Paenibacillus sabuli]|uniref:hypothetical protein n=1 Tax=Paenibacillus sabuli TaxID=2772509 RepID=UPI001CC285A0